MKVVGINGSARKGGNTAILIKRAFTALEKEGIQTELVEMGGKTIRGCMACGKCKKEKNRKCAIETDMLNDLIGKMDAADGIILGSPTYFTDVSAEMKALIDRAGTVARANDHMFRRKPGAAVVAVRRAGSLHVFDTINHFFLISQMVIPGSVYWNMGIGMDKGDVEKDDEGLLTMDILGKNMAWLMKKTAE